MQLRPRFLGRHSWQFQQHYLVPCGAQWPLGSCQGRPDLAFHEQQTAGCLHKAPALLSLFSLWVLSLTAWFEPLPYTHCRWRPTKCVQLYSCSMFFSSSHTRNICSNNRDATKQPPPSCSLTSGKLALKGYASKSHRHFTLSTGIPLQIPAKSQEWALALRSFQAVMLDQSCNFLTASIC